MTLLVRGTIPALFFLLGWSALHSQVPIPTAVSILVDDNSAPREHPADMLHLRLETKFDALRGSVNGRVTHTFKVLQRVVDSIEFDAIDITFTQVMLGGKPARYRRTDSTVIVYCEPALKWDAIDSIAFTYTARPQKGLYFIGWQDTTNTMRRQVWSQGQGIDTRHWIPLYDEMNDKVVTELIVTFDSAYTVISNGDLKNKTSHTDGSRSWHYAMNKPHAPYLIMVAVGKYAKKDTAAANGVPMHLYYYPDLPETIEPTYRYSTEAMDFLEREIGIPYPWNTYSQIPLADYIFGAMENTTATVFGDFYVTDSRGWLDRYYVNTNVHELTHQWFGDYVTARSITHHWLQESFATFYPHIYTREWQGEDAYQFGRRNMHNAALRASERDRFPIVHVKAGGERVYQKGASVLDMMRYTFGADQLRRVIQHYARHHAYGNVETNDLYQAFQDTLGLSPDWFFKQWLYQGGEPEYQVSYSSITNHGMPGSDHSTKVDVRQIHQTDHLTGYFKMPVVIEVHYEGGGVNSVRTIIEGEHTSVVIPNPREKNVAFVLFDPGSYILKRMSFNRSYQELSAQAEAAPLMIDRFDAIMELTQDRYVKQVTADQLEKWYNKESFHATKTAVLNLAIRLKKLGVNEATRLIERGIIDPDVQVRKFIVHNLRIIDLDVRNSFERLLSDSSYEIVEHAFQNLCALYPQDRARYISMVSGVVSPAKRVEIAILEQQVTSGNSESLELLAELVSNRFEFITRQNAMRAIKRTGVLTTKAFKWMVNALNNPNTRLSDVANQTLSWFAEIPRYKSLMITALGSIPATDRTQKLAKILL
jgi:aminopeptidase N